MFDGKWKNTRYRRSMLEGIALKARLFGGSSDPFCRVPEMRAHLRRFALQRSFTPSCSSITDANVVLADAAKRLINATRFRNSSFIYDGDGNRVSQSVGTSTYNYINDVATALPVVLQESGPVF